MTAFTAYFTNVKNYTFKFTCEVVKDNLLCSSIEEEGSLNTKVYKKHHTQTNTNFLSHTILYNIRTFIGPLNHQDENVLTKDAGQEKEKTCISGALKTCSYTNWTSNNNMKKNRKDHKKRVNGKTSLQPTWLVFSKNTTSFTFMLISSSATV